MLKTLLPLLATPATGCRPRSFLGRLFHRSVTAQVLLHSPIPVLMLPAVE